VAPPEYEGLCDAADLIVRSALLARVSKDAASSGA
jgi:hypothetical protein